MKSRCPIQRLKMKKNFNFVPFFQKTYFDQMKWVKINLNSNYTFSFSLCLSLSLSMFHENKKQKKFFFLNIRRNSSILRCSFIPRVVVIVFYINYTNFPPLKMTKTKKSLEYAQCSWIVCDMQFFWLRSHAQF